MYISFSIVVIFVLTGTNGVIRCHSNISLSNIRDMFVCLLFFKTIV